MASGVLMFIPVPGLIISTAVWIQSVVLLINLLTQDFRLNRVSWRSSAPTRSDGRSGHDRDTAPNRGSAPPRHEHPRRLLVGRRERDEGSAPESDVENESDGGRIVIEDEDGSLTVETGGELPQAIRDAFAVPSDQLVDFTSAMTDGRMTFVSVYGHVERDNLRSLTNELTAAVTSELRTIVTSFGSGEDKQLIVASRDD